MYVGVREYKEPKYHPGLDNNGRAPRYAGAPLALKSAAPKPEEAAVSFARQLENLEQGRIKPNLSLSEGIIPGKKHARGAVAPPTLKAKVTSPPEVTLKDSFSGGVMKGHGRFL